MHLHEEIKGAGTRYAEWDHVGGHVPRLQAPAGGGRYRAGRLSRRPLRLSSVHEPDARRTNEHPRRLLLLPRARRAGPEAIWTDAEPIPATTFPRIRASPAAGQKRSARPRDTDRVRRPGSRYRNILHVEQSELDNLLRVWDAIVARAERQGPAADRALPLPHRLGRRGRSGSSATAASSTSCRERWHLRRRHSRRRPLSTR